MYEIAHRGASAYFKENTIPAFAAALNMGSVFFETDVQLSKDGVLVLFHDYHFYNSSGKKIIIKETPFKELAKYEVPSLSELFDCLGTEVKINLEIKNDDNLYPGIEKKLITYIKENKKANPARLLISSFDHPTLERVRNLDKKIKIGLLTREFKIEEALKIKAYSINMSRSRITPEIIKKIKKASLKVLVYTVNDKREALEFKNYGVDGIFTDYPELLSGNYASLGLSQ